MPQQSRPVYLKLRDQIAAAIIEGVYAEGEMLPCAPSRPSRGPTH